MYRNTYVEINLSNIEYNIKKFISTYNNYKYYFGVVKADCYGHYNYKTVSTIINAGCNYLAVATLDEAITIRKHNKDIPILCLGIIPSKYIKVAINNNITVTISNLDYLSLISKYLDNNLKVHLKINTGMNRLGFKSKEDLNKSYNILKEHNVNIEGIYTHIYNSNNKQDTNNQITKFEELTSSIDLNSIKIIHLFASDATESYPKPSYVNACRLGIVMYGFGKLSYKSTFSLISNIVQINELNPNETLGYNGTYKCTSKEKIAVIPIGYADGIIRKNTNRYVYINDKKYQIVGNICMDMLFIKVDYSVKVNDKVYIIKDNKHIEEISSYLDTIPYEVICSIGKRVPRKYIVENK